MIQHLSTSYLDITLDSGATVSYLRHDMALNLGVQIFPNNQLALLADQRTRMASLGEVDFIVLIASESISDEKPTSRLFWRNDIPCR